jgi:transcriptional regulator with XRE-family HTH domain
MPALGMISNLEQRSLPAIAARLQKARKALGFKTQKEFAERVGIQGPTYNQWEKAKAYPDLQFAIRLRDEYNLSLDWIYLGDPAGLPYHMAKLLSAEPSEGDPHPDSSRSSRFFTAAE